MKTHGTSVRVLFIRCLLLTAVYFPGSRRHADKNRRNLKLHKQAISVCIM